MNEQLDNKAIQLAGGDTFSLPQMQAQMHAIEEMKKDILREGVHFGTIPGCGDKPALFKSGAEKLAFRFRMAPKFRGEDNPRDLGNGHREYIITCEMYSIITGVYLGAGVGSCSTMEAKYRYRGQNFEETGEVVPGEYWNAKKKDPRAAQALIGGPGFVTKKIDGQWLIVRQLGERQENLDLADTYNTVLKQAKKRAMVDAVLTCTAASDLFDQDIDEKIDEKTAAGETKTNSKEEKPAGAPHPAGANKPQTTTTAKEIFKMACQVPQFQLTDASGIILDDYNQPKINYSALGLFFKEKGMAVGSVKDMAPEQLAQAKAELEKLSGGAQ